VTGQPSTGQPPVAGRPDPPPRVATLGARLIARAVDTVLLLLALLPLRLGFGWLGLDQGPHYDAVTGRLDDGGSPLLRNVLVGMLLAAAIAYEVVLTAGQGATIGKRVMRLRVVRRRDGCLPGWGPALVRWLVPAAGLLVCLIGELVVYASPLLDGTGFNRGWHDRLAGTVVIRE
jgi:uncharacterized RDD family membrane protein YckC